MKPRSFTPLGWRPRSSRRSTAWKNVACESANARWCTQPGSVGVRAGSATRSSSVKTVIRRPSPGSKYRWLSDALSRFGCSKTKGMPSTPSQKSIDVCRPAPTIVMWCTPWDWSLRMATVRLPAMLPYDEAGSGPAVVLLHEGIADRSMWAELLEPIAAAGVRVVALDLPGFGDAPVPEHFQPHHDVLATLDELAIWRAVFVGVSF